MIRRYNSPEILAPCGSYDILTAAVKAGADACYIGGSRFGARAYADNLDEKSIVKAIDYAHIHGVRLYLTVNTLLKNSEAAELVDYIIPYYEAGIDAVIVQDMGAFEIIKNNFPELSIHCSTQMNINSVHAAGYMYEHGAKRVVTAREMSLRELRRIKEQVGIEVETFVHGAMCYSYSGQCLMSSVAGSRSGNRGRCAQPCRKCYSGSYILSMKDMCALENIPELIKAGIDSFKIEGRMKNEYYVASAVLAYREMRDAALSGEFDDLCVEKYKKFLAGIYNRGGFTAGYFHYGFADEPKFGMISEERPNNQGVPIGRLISAKDGKIKLGLTEDIYVGDVLEISLRDKSIVDVTCACGGSAGTTVLLPSPKTRLVRLNQTVYRTRSRHILEYIDKNILNAKDSFGKIHVRGYFTAQIDDAISFTLKTAINKKQYEITVTGDKAEKALNCQTKVSDIEAKLNQLGGTEYVFDSLKVDVADGCFVPAGGLKGLRRDALSRLSDVIAGAYRRVYKPDDKPAFSAIQCRKNTEYSDKDNFVYAEFSDLEQLKCAAEYDYIRAVYIDRQLYTEADAVGLIDKIRQVGTDIYIALPYIIDCEFDIDKYLPKADINGIYIRNIDSYAAAIRAGLDERYTFVCASSLYAYNDVARAYFYDGFKDCLLELPRELTLKEMSGFNDAGSIFPVYGHQQAMLSAQCVYRNKYGCGKNNDIVKFADDRQHSFYARCICSECCNVIYNGVPYSMLDRLDELSDLSFCRGISLHFTIEDTRTAGEILDYCGTVLSGNAACNYSKKIFTAGHCYRGVE